MGLALFLLYSSRKDSSSTARQATPTISNKAEVAKPSAPGPSGVARLHEMAAHVKSTQAAKPPSGVQYLELQARAALNSKQEELKLTTKEASAIEQIFVKYQEIKALYEASIVQQASFSGGTLQLRIPPYVEAGKALRDLFYRDVQQAVTPEKAAIVDDHLGSYFDERFLAFGNCEQNILVTQNVDPSSGTLYSIKRKVSVVTGDATPGVTSGYGAFTGATSEATYTREQLESGEYSSLAEAIKRAYGEDGK